jgi:predicted Zn-dependent peptidase
MHPIHTHQFSNGLWLVAEPMPAAASLAMTLLTPAGTAAESSGRQGVAAVLGEMLFRGAGDRDARAHSDALDQLGVQRSVDVQRQHMTLSATMLGPRLGEALPLLCDMVRRPLLAEASLEPARDLALQDLDALEDTPQDKTFIELRRLHLPAPFNRSSLGVREHIEALDIADVRAFARGRLVPGGAVLAFAGKLDWAELRDLVESRFGDWRGDAATPAAAADALRGYGHVKADSTQVHIGLAYDAVEETDPRSMLQRAAVAVLSGGMSGRLFTQVREKRGLCYAVFSRYAADQHRGMVLAYAGTTTARAQETLDVLTGELRRLGDGVDRGEFERAVVGMKSSLIMQGESTPARSGALAADQAVRGRPRSLGELAAEVDALSLEALNDFVAGHRPGEMTTVTIGPAALHLPQSVGAQA